MTWIQRTVLRFAGSRAEAIEAETRSWVVTCPRCQHQQSYWDLGGIRYGASSTGKKIRATCPSCGTKAISTVSRLPDRPDAGTTTNRPRAS